MKFYVGQYTIKPGDERASYIVQLRAVLKASELITIIEPAEMTCLKTLYDFDSTGVAIVRMFPKMSFFKQHLKTIIHGRTESGRTLSITDIQWRGFTVEPFDLDTQTVLAVLTGKIRKCDDNALEYLRVACENDHTIEMTFSSIQADTTDWLDGDGLLHVLRTGKMPKSEKILDSNPADHGTIIETSKTDKQNKPVKSMTFTGGGMETN